MRLEWVVFMQFRLEAFRWRVLCAFLYDWCWVNVFLMLTVGEMLSETADVFIRYHARRCFAHQGGGLILFGGIAPSLSGPFFLRLFLSLSELGFEFRNFLISTQTFGMRFS
jgi:hypothetical protein